MVVGRNLIECPICYDNCLCISLECGHKFCKSCIRNTIKHFNTDLNDEFSCPLCRSSITEINDKKTNGLLILLYDKINARKMGDNVYGVHIFTEILYFYFPIKKDILNYPKNNRFYTYEQKL